MRKRLGLGILAVVAVCAIAAPAFAGVDDDIYPMKEVVAGRTIGEWSGAWWQWAWSLVDGDGVSAPVHPLLDTTGEWAGEGQSGPVFFLGGSFIPGTYERHIVVPAGKALFFPLLNQSADNYICGAFDPMLSINTLRYLIEQAQNNPQQLILEIDGKAVGNLQRFRLTSPVYSVFLAEGGLCTPTAANLFYETQPGEYMQQVSDGYFVMVKPLMRGDHTIRLGGTSADGNFSLDVTYYITVE